MSNCTCIVDIDFNDAAEISTSTIRKARKSHECCECDREIIVGEHYEEATLLYDGSWDRYRTCLDCLSVRSAMFCGCWYYTHTWEELEESLRERWEELPPSSAMMALTPRAREMVCDMIEKIWEEETLKEETEGNPNSIRLDPRDQAENHLINTTD